MLFKDNELRQESKINLKHKNNKKNTKTCLNNNS